MKVEVINEHEQTIAILEGPTLPEIKDAIAKKKGYFDFAHACKERPNIWPDLAFDEVVEESDDF